MSNIVKKDDPTFSSFITAPTIRAKIEQTLGNEGLVRQFISSSLSLVASNPKFKDVSNGSIFNAVLQAATLGLPVSQNLGFAWVIPYKNNAQFQIGVNGLKQLALRTGQIEKLNSCKIYKGQFQGYDDFGEPNIDFNAEHTANVVGYYAVFKLVNGYVKKVYMTVAEILAHAKRFSKSVNDGPWKTDFDAMAEKTVMKRLLKGWAMLSTDGTIAPLSKALEEDQKVYDATGKGEYLDNPTNVEDKETKTTVRNTILQQEEEEPKEEEKVEEVKEVKQEPSKADSPTKVEDEVKNLEGFEEVLF